MITVSVVSPFPIRGLAEDGTLALPENACVSDLLRKSLPAALYAKVVPVSVNGRQVQPSHPLKNGDMVVIIFPSSGG